MSSVSSYMPKNLQGLMASERKCHKLIDCSWRIDVHNTGATLVVAGWSKREHRVKFIYVAL